MVYRPVETGRKMQNIVGTSSKSDTGLTQRRSAFDLKSSRRDLLSVRSKHGERQNLGALIRQSLVDLGGLQ